MNTAKNLAVSLTLASSILNERHFGKTKQISVSVSCLQNINLWNFTWEFIHQAKIIFSVPTACRPSPWLGLHCEQIKNATKSSSFSLEANKLCKRWRTPCKVLTLHGCQKTANCWWPTVGADTSVCQLCNPVVHDRAIVLFKKSLRSETVFVGYLSMNETASFSILEVVFSRFIGCSVISWFLIRIQFQYLVNP